MKPADFARIANLVLFAILLVIQIVAVYYLYTLQQNTACSCAHTTELAYLLAISVVNLVLMVVQPSGSVHLQVITTFVGLFATFAFAVLGYQYLQKIRACACARTESLEHHLFKAAVFVRILSAALFVAAVIIGFVYGFMVAAKKGAKAAAH